MNRVDCAIRLTPVLALCITGTALAQNVPVFVDGLFDEWQSTEALYSDVQGDGQGSVDFGRIWAQNDDRFVFIAIEVGGTVSLQSTSDITLRMDTDADAATGIPGCGIGAELIWEFSERIGSFTFGGSNVPVASQDIGLVSAPTVTSSIFELTLDLDATPRRLGPLFPGDEVHVCLQHGDNGDRLPDAGQTVTFAIDRSVVPQPVTIDVDRRSTSALRLLAWNVEQDGLFESNKTNSFGRILRLIDPDVIVFSEIFGHTTGQTLARMTELTPGTQWFAAAASSSVTLLSKSPVVETLTVDSNGRARGFLLEGSDAFETGIFVVGAHLYCCEADDRRQSQVDQIMAAIRDGQLEGRIPPMTPIILAGDMNFVGDYRQPRTLVEGVIVSPALGPSFEPDWDQTSFTDARPVTTGLPQTFTWLNPGAPNDRQFSPGRLDYVIYSDAVLTLEASFALYTAAIPFTDLQELGLNASDTGSASDHLPVVADFAPKNHIAAEFVAPGPRPILDLDLYPNPTSSRLWMRMTTDRPADVAIHVYNLNGQRVASKPARAGSAFETLLEVNVESLPPGVYLVEAVTTDEIVRSKFVKAVTTN